MNNIPPDVLRQLAALNNGQMSPEDYTKNKQALDSLKQQLDQLAILNESAYYAWKSYNQLHVASSSSGFDLCQFYPYRATPSQPTGAAPSAQPPAAYNYFAVPAHLPPHQFIHPTHVNAYQSYLLPQQPAPHVRGNGSHSVRLDNSKRNLTSFLLNQKSKINVNSRLSHSLHSIHRQYIQFHQRKVRLCSTHVLHHSHDFVHQPLKRSLMHLIELLVPNVREFATLTGGMRKSNHIIYPAMNPQPPSRPLPELNRSQGRLPLICSVFIAR
jgi:hypothetical protein